MSTTSWSRFGPHRFRRAVATVTLATLTILASSAWIGNTAEGALSLRLVAGGDYAQAVRLDPPQLARSVFVVGDSLMVGVVDSRYLNGPSLLQVLAADGVDATASVRVARTIPQATTALSSFRATIRAADTIVVGLGTNDIFNSGGITVEAWRASISAFVETVASINPTARVVWVDVSFRRVANRAVAFNSLLGTFARAGHLEVCPWREYILAHPEWLAGDGLHLRPAGYAARRDLILSCIGPR